MIAFRSPISKKLYPFQSPVRTRTLDDINTFEVTQRFGSLDGYFPGQLHGAVDIGNGHCGEPILAMAAGIAHRVSDGAGALGEVVDHGGGVSTAYWHLNVQTALEGQRVIAGDQVGVLGSTGLGAVCHCHIELKINGEKIDPEPYLFGATYGDNDDMPELTAYAPATVTLLPGTRVRIAPQVAPSTFAFQLVAAQNRNVGSVGTVAGQLVAGSTAWHVYWDAANRRWLYVHASTVEKIVPLVRSNTPPPPAAPPVLAPGTAIMAGARVLAVTAG